MFRMPSLAENLAFLVAALRAALSAYGIRLARPPHSAWIGDTQYVAIAAPEPLPPLAPELWTLFWNRLGRLQRRFAALHEAWTSGTLRPVRPRKPSTPPTPAAEPASQAAATPAPRLPRAFGWVVRRVPEAGPSAGRLEALLQEEEARRFVTEVPRAGRLLRPLCRALGQHPPAWLRLPPRPRRPRPRPARPPRPSLRDPTLKWRDWELPAIRGFLSKYGKG